MLSKIIHEIRFKSPALKISPYKRQNSAELRHTLKNLLRLSCRKKNKDENSSTLLVCKPKQEAIFFAGNNTTADVCSSRCRQEYAQTYQNVFTKYGPYRLHV